MADTTLTLESRTKRRLEQYRHADHNSWTEVLDGVMDMLPSIDDVREGCARCGTVPWGDVPSEDLNGFVQWFNHTIDDRTFRHSSYYCSSDCVVEAVEEMQSYVPEHPDLVRVGGRNELATGFSGATFYLDGESTEVGIPLPGAFAGSDVDGNEYSFEGEPVYIKNEDKWIHSGVISDIIHEDAHTALILEKDFEVEMLHHPDEERRAEYEDRHEEGGV